MAYWADSEGSNDAICRAVLGLREIQNTTGASFQIVLHYGEVLVGQDAGQEKLIGNEAAFLLKMQKLADSLNEACVISDRARTKLATIGALNPTSAFCFPGFEGRQFFRL